MVIIFEAIICCTKKLLRLIKTPLVKSQSKEGIGNYLSSSSSGENGLKAGDILSSLLFNSVLEYANRKVQQTNLGLDMNGSRQVMSYADDVNFNRR